MDAADAAGITFFDTADVYPLGAGPDLFGRTEELVGEWMGGRRDEFIVATKCFFPTGPKPWDAGNSRKNIMRAIDASLRRLQTEYVDLYQIHFWDPRTPMDRNPACAAMSASGMPSHTTSASSRFGPTGTANATRGLEPRPPAGLSYFGPSKGSR